MSLRLMVGASLKLAGRYILNGCRSVPQLHHGRSVQFHRNCRWNSANSLFYKKNEEQHIIVIPIDSHTAFYFPPTSLDLRQWLVSKCLQFLNFLYMAGWRGNNVLLPRDTSLLSKKFIEFP